MGTEVKLLGYWSSPYVYRIIWALKLKGVDFDYIEEDIFNKSTQLIELNPVHKKVPVFVHGKKVIAESFVIIEYIDETWPQYPLLPSDPYERATARFWAKFSEDKLSQDAWIAMWSEGEQKERAINFSIEALENIEDTLKGKKYLGGENIGYLDIINGWIAYWLPIWEEVGSMQILDKVKFPATAEWVTHFLNHPVIRDNLPPSGKMLAYFHKRREVISNHHGSLSVN